MSLIELQNNFKEQAELTGEIIVDSEVLVASNLDPADQFDLLIETCLLLDTEPPLTVKTTYIPDPEGDTLTITGTASIVGLKDISVTLVFTVDASSKTQLFVESDLSLVTGWTLTQSFPALPAYPSDNLDFTTPMYLFTTETEQSGTWQNQTWTLSQGLNFASTLLLTEALDDIPLFFKDSSITQGSLFFKGTIDTSGLGKSAGSIYPKLNLEGAIEEEVELPGYTVRSPLISYTITSEEKATDPEDEESGTYESFKLQFQFVVTLDSGEPQDDSEWQFYAQIIQNSQNYTFNLDEFPRAGLEIETIENLLAGTDFMAVIPEIIKGYFEESIALKTLSASYYIESDATTISNATTLGATIGTFEVWELSTVFQIEDIDLSYTLSYSASDTSTFSILSYFTARFQFYSEPPDDLFPGYFEIEMQQQGENELTISSQYYGDVYLSSIIEVMSNHTLSVPSELGDVVFSDFGVVTSSDTGGENYNFFASAEVDFPFEILGAEVVASFDVNVNWITSETGTATTYYLVGGLTLGDSYFSLELNFDSTNQSFTAEWEALNEDYLGINDLMDSLNLNLFSIPEGLDLDLKSAGIYYEFDTKTMTLEALSARYGSVKVICQNVSPSSETPQWEYVFIYKLDVNNGDCNFSINYIPLFGTLPDDQCITLNTFQVTGSSSIITEAQMNEQGWQELAGEEYILPESIDYPGASISADLVIGSYKCPLYLELSTAEPPESEYEPASNALTNTENTSSSSMNALTLWINIQNTLGPLYLNRIGFSFQDGDFCMLLDATVDLVSLQISVIGLSVRLPIKTKDYLSDLSFAIEGMSVDFIEPPMEISGGLMKVPTDNGELQFDGEVILAAPELKVLGLGSYTTMSNGDSSLFVIAMLNKALGGTPYFFVTGIAAGFGYNRALVIPVQSTVQNFPLVAGLTDPSAIGGTNPTPSEALATLVDWTPVEQGQYWLAFGVQGTTFEVINTNALFVVQFGNQLIISIIGVSTLKQPQTGQAFTYACLDLVANFIPEEGEITLGACLEKGAYVLSPDAHLKGEFAFSSWFGSSPYSGDFVFTIGGYNQYFVPPDHYPNVGAVSLDWKVMPGLSFTGSAYFAIVPSAMMAGADMEMSYSEGGLKAWLKVRMDVLLFWKPFYFIADVSVNVGVSLRMKVFGVTSTISAEVGAIYHMWGPKTGGSVYIDWCILSFTIKFGASKDVPSSIITWDQFQELLPSKPPVSSNAALRTSESDQKSYLYINVENGLTNSKVLDDGEHWLVRAESFSCGISSAIPASLITVSNYNSDDWIYAGQKVGMCNVEGGISPEQYQCDELITVLKMDEDDESYISQCMITSPEYNPAGISSTIDVSQWNLEVIENGMPTAMWTNTETENDLDTTNQTVTASVGISLAPKSPTMNNGTPVMIIEDVFTFQIINDFNDDQLSIDPNKPADSIEYQFADSFIDISQIMTTEVSTLRGDVYTELVSFGIVGLENKPLDRMAADPGSDFVDEPMLESLTG